MRPKSAKGLWCDEHGITLMQARLLGGVERLKALEENRPDVFATVISDMKKFKKTTKAA